ncbi:hypothetical protein O9H85_08575 [Paenibacillus filicis]|uniref:Lipoprotein n=1 Tax=Paenibacillus gyeongsangnamensis TaxID=3388067 RepID=A0ABT4Q6I6_9BACL|nr:hypothetical protein [Paenibacillus filicis]MCZ8512487.1 hypothetical protein [Paenibacillus filicis]
MEQQRNGRTQRAVSLFMAAALVLGGSGCSSESNCTDRNRDGYCDNGSGSSGSGSGFYKGGGSDIGSGKSSAGDSSGISQGSHGGIGGGGSSSS